MAVDQEQVRELEIFKDNYEPAYRQQEAWIKNYKRKQASNRYNRELAIKGIRDNFVPQLIKMYNKEYGGIGPVSKETKHAFAVMWVKEFEDGDYDD